MKAWFMRLLGYEFVERPGYIGCCRYWTNCNHPPVWWHPKRHKRVGGK